MLSINLTVFEFLFITHPLCPHHLEREGDEFVLKEFHPFNLPSPNALLCSSQDYDQCQNHDSRA